MKKAAQKFKGYEMLMDVDNSMDGCEDLPLVSGMKTIVEEIEG